MLLLVGLGNPGREHERNRHNIGFMAVDEIAHRHGFGSSRSRFQGLVAEGMVTGEKVLALKPMTYMNESGRAVSEAVRFYKLPPEDVVVIYDELDLAPGKLRVKRGGGSAGHNGLRSIDAHIGRDYRRVRIGIGHPGNRALVHNYILGNFARADAEWIEPILGAIADALPDLIDGEDDRFMTRVAAATQPQRPGPPKPADRKEATKPAAAPAEDKREDSDPRKTSLASAFEAAIARLRKI